MMLRKLELFVNKLPRSQTFHSKQLFRFEIRHFKDASSSNICQYAFTSYSNAIFWVNDGNMVSERYQNGSKLYTFLITLINNLNLDFKQVAVMEGI